MDNESIQTAHEVLKVLTIILSAGLVLSWLAKKFRVPDVVLFLIGGIVLGPAMSGVLQISAETSSNQFILTFGSAVILFHGGMSTELGVLKKVWLSLVLLATTGVLISALVMGAAAYTLTGISFVTALLAGAVIASTDPAALIPILQKIKVRAKVSQTVVAESAFNDATGAILVTVLISIIAGGSFSLTADLLAFFKLAGIGLAVGVCLGLVSAYLISHRSRYAMEDSESVTAILAVLASYLIAEGLGGSGFMAVFSAGLVLGNGPLFRMTYQDTGFQHANHFMEFLGLKMRMLIFILLGSQVNFAEMAKYAWVGVLLILVFMFIARPLTVLTSTLLDKNAKWEWRELIFFMWTRETGVIPAALAGIIAGKHLPGASFISSLTFMAILATLLIQATTTPWLANRLGLKE